MSDWRPEWMKNYPWNWLAAVLIFRPWWRVRCGLGWHSWNSPIRSRDGRVSITVCGGCGKFSEVVTE